MTPADFTNIVRKKTKTNSTTFPDADVLLYMKLRMEELALDLADVDENLTTVPQIENLVADQREYPLHEELCARIKKVYAKLDATNWLCLDNIDLTHHDKPIDETNITYYFSNLENQCFYEIRHSSILLYSGTITAVANGLKYLFNRYPIEILDLASTVDLSKVPVTTTLSIGTTDTQVASSRFQYGLSSVGYMKTAVLAGTALASGTIPANKWGIYLFSINTSGTITCTAGAANFTTGYADEATAIAALPDTPDGEYSMGYFTVKTAAGQPFIGGTDALEGGSSGNPSSDTNYYPTTGSTVVNSIAHGIPKALHEIWARGVSIDYKQNKEKPIALSERELKYEADKMVALAKLKRGSLDRTVQGHLPPASARGNDGYDF